MTHVSFPESSFGFREVIRGVVVLALTVGTAASPSAMAGAWEYQAPFSMASTAGTNGITAATGTGPGMQLFRENQTYSITPYYPPAQPQQSTNWLPFAMVGLALAPMLFSDSPANHGVATAPKTAKATGGYQLAKDAPTGQTVRRGPAAIPLRTRYQQAQPQQNSAGAR